MLFFSCQKPSEERLPELTLYTKTPCPLCDEALEALSPALHRVGRGSHSPLRAARGVSACRWRRDPVTGKVGLTNTARGWCVTPECVGRPDDTGLLQLDNPIPLRGASRGAEEGAIPGSEGTAGVHQCAVTGLESIRQAGREPGRLQGLLFQQHQAEYGHQHR